MRIVLAAAFLAAFPALADTLPSPVTARMSQDQEDCGASAKFEDGFVTRKDVNGDGVPDYILDYAHFACSGSHTFCGSGGCTTAIYASKDGEFVKAFDDLVQRLIFTTSKGRPAIQLGLHGSGCGKVGSAQCSVTLYWNVSAFSATH